MSNEIKNTLFRFVSMRAPELVTETSTKPGFVFQNDKDKGVFNTATSSIPAGSTRQAELKNTAINFKSNAKNVDGLKALNVKLYDFSVWLAKNRFSATEAEISAKAKLITTTTLDLKTVWDNLFYQVITQSDFYAKEVAMQLLLAYHVRVATTIGTYKERALAKIVLPKEVFFENKQNSQEVSLRKGNGSSTEVPFASHTMQKLENKAIAEENKRVLNKLKVELEKAEVIHQKNYNSQFKDAFESHEAKIKPELDAYYLEIEEQKNKWCEVQDPKTPYDPKNPCSQPPMVPQPVLPEFHYPYDDSIDENFLAEVISRESFEIYKKMIDNDSEFYHGEQVEEIFKSKVYREKYTSLPNNYRSISEIIANIIENNDAVIQQNTIDNGSSSLVIGSTVITVPNTISPLLPFQYEVKTRRRSVLLSDSDIKLQISLGIPDDAFKISQLKYKMKRNDGTFIEKTSTDIQHFSGYDASLNLSMTGISTNLLELLITFQFVNGQLATLLIPSFNISSIYKGYVQVELNDDDLSNDNSSPISNPSGVNTVVAPDETFIPSGFGMKQIGIADYNKVEQTIQGYIEGEVAHIENIMAREFKEKSTRRLRRSEITETTSSETERENLTDTSTVDRFEMQSEVAKVIANSKDFAAQTGMQYEPKVPGKLILNANVNFATHNSKEESTRQAVTNSKEITERALDRIISKVKEERIEKILEEFEENNTHGFDNRKGDQHVIGVYRWVDKVYKNQIINYGKRLMFEFAIPEPARLHWLAIQSLANEKNAKAIAKPQDPRTASNNKLENYSQLDDTRLKHWSGIYNVEFKPKPIHQFNTGKSLGGMYNSSLGRVESMAFQDEIKIPEGYIAIKGTASYTAATDGEAASASALIGPHGFWFQGRWGQLGSNPTTQFNTPFSNVVPISTTFYNEFNGTVNFDITCQLTQEAENQWKQETFNAIIKAYEEALEKYNQTIAQEAANGVQILGTNPGFYREIENTILRKNCISYMISSNPDAKRTFGKDFYTKNKTSDNEITFSNATIKQTADLDDYASFVKFMEQAFEWDIMSYYFYPFYWGKRNNWAEMYRYEDSQDHIFKAFMQSGMARVIVTVRPGFEEAVRYYMQTGQIWNGGEVPVIGDELYLSIVEEMRKTEGEKVGKAWPTRVPTSMTILQAESIGLKVDKALPYNDDLSDFEDENEVPKSTDIKNNPEAQIGVSSEEQGIRHIENIDINNGYLQLTTDDTPRQIVAQISVQAIKNAIDQTTNP